MGLVNQQDENRARWLRVLLGAALGLVVGLIIAALVWTNVLSFGVTWWPVVFAVTTCSGALGGWLFHWKSSHARADFSVRPTPEKPSVQVSSLENGCCYTGSDPDFVDVPLGEEVNGASVGYKIPG